jgi:hypothetical protein
VAVGQAVQESAHQGEVSLDGPRQGLAFKAPEQGHGLGHCAGWVHSRAALALFGMGSGQLRIRVGTLFEQGEEMPLAAHAVGPQAHGAGERFPAVRPFRAARREMGRRGRGHQIKERVFVEEPGDDPLVLLGSEGAGGIDEPPPGAQHGRCTAQDGQLPPGMGLQLPFVPLPDRVRVFAEHAFPRAGGVDEDAVEIAGEPRGESVGRFVQHEGVFHPEPFQVDHQGLDARRMDFIRHQETPVAHALGQVRRLAAGGGAQVEHALPRLRVEEGRRGHGAGLLQVIEPGGVVGMLARLGGLVAVEAFRTPWHRVRRQAEAARQLHGGDLQRVDPEAVGAPFAVAGHKGGEFRRAQERAHAAKKGFGQLRVHQYRSFRVGRGKGRRKATRRASARRESLPAENGFWYTSLYSAQTREATTGEGGVVP